MADGDADSETHLGADDPELEAETPINLALLGHWSVLMLQEITGLIESALAQNRIEMERMAEAKLSSRGTDNRLQPPRSDENIVKHTEDDITRSQSHRTSFKTFKGCGAMEFYGRLDPVGACTWLEEIEPIFDISHCWKAD